MSSDCELKPGAELNVDDVSRIACALKSLAMYSMLAYEHNDDPDDLQVIVDDGLDAIHKLFEC
jgi:hypothetical protein